MGRKARKLTKAEVVEETEKIEQEEKLKKNDAYQQYLKEHKKKLRRLMNEANGIWEPDYD